MDATEVAGPHDFGTHPNSLTQNDVSADPARRVRSILSLERSERAPPSGPGPQAGPQIVKTSENLEIRGGTFILYVFLNENALCAHPCMLDGFAFRMCFQSENALCANPFVHVCLSVLSLRGSSSSVFTCLGATGTCFLVFLHLLEPPGPVSCFCESVLPRGEFPHVLACVGTHRGPFPVVFTCFGSPGFQFLLLLHICLGPGPCFPVLSHVLRPRGTVSSCFYMCWVPRCACLRFA